MAPVSPIWIPKSRCTAPVTLVIHSKHQTQLFHATTCCDTINARCSGRDFLCSLRNLKMIYAKFSPHSGSARIFFIIIMNLQRGKTRVLARFQLTLSVCPTEHLMCESLLCENKSLGNLMCASSGKSFFCREQVEDRLVVCHRSLAQRTVQSCKFGCDSNGMCWAHGS